MTFVELALAFAPRKKRYPELEEAEAWKLQCRKKREKQKRQPIRRFEGHGAGRRGQRRKRWSIRRFKDRCT